jgi:thymidine phosphorylase
VSAIDSAGLLQVLQRKRDGETLTDGELRQWFRAVVDGAVDDAQLGAFAMAVWLRGMTDAETRAMTLAMRDCGERMDWRQAGLDGPVLDKHSTGGVGDLTSLVLAPMVAACGGYMPMLSGRALGHTGGTLDKLAAIPGLLIEPDPRQLRRVVRDAGFALFPASSRVVPADRRLYEVRDRTATVDSIPLITASILAKKLAGGSQALALDVKCGNGANLPDARLTVPLARLLVETAASAGLRCTAWLSDMNQPLVADIGDSLEMRLALAYLRGDVLPSRLHALCMTLGCELLLLGGLAQDLEQAHERLERARSSGAAAERFMRMCRGLGGPADLLEDPARYLHPAPLRVALTATRSGTLASIDTRALGLAVQALRADAGPAGGLEAVAELGAQMESGTALAWIHARDTASLERVQPMLQRAFVIGDDAVAPPCLFHGAPLRGG